MVFACQIDDEQDQADHDHCSRVAIHLSRLGMAAAVNLSR
jgi:hypothetical protein